MPGREKSDDKHRRGNIDGQCLLEELPRDGHVILEADVGDQQVG